MWEAASVIGVGASAQSPAWSYQYPSGTRDYNDFGYQEAYRCAVRNGQIPATDIARPIVFSTHKYDGAHPKVTQVNLRGCGVPAQQAHLSSQRITSLRSWGF